MLIPDGWHKRYTADFLWRIKYVGCCILRRSSTTSRKQTRQDSWKDKHQLV